MPTVSVPEPPVLGDHGELLNALQAAQQAAVLQLLPQAIARGLGGHSFWSLYWLTQGTEPHPTDLARTLGITAPACTSMVDLLVESGHVQRRPSAEDRRQVVLTVTPKGRRTVDAIWGHVDQQIRAATRDLSDEDVATAARVLRTVAARLRPDGGHP